MLIDWNWVRGFLFEKLKWFLAWFCLSYRFKLLVFVLACFLYMEEHIGTEGFCWWWDKNFLLFYWLFCNHLWLALIHFSLIIFRSCDWYFPKCFVLPFTFLLVLASIDPFSRMIDQWLTNISFKLFKAILLLCWFDRLYYLLRFRLYGSFLRSHLEFFSKFAQLLFDIGVFFRHDSMATM